MRVVIIGAGLAGLSAAIALAQRGCDVRVYEQAPELREVGAGITVARNARHVLAALGIADRAVALGSFTRSMPFLHYRTGKVLAGGRDDERRPADGEAGFHMHRADLHRLLAERFEELAPGGLILGARLAAVEETAHGATACFEDGGRVAADLLVAADGVRSVVRRSLWNEGAPRFTGQLAYRFMLPGDAAAPHLREHGRAALFMGPGRVVNRYTLRGGALLNCVGITQSDAWLGEGWSEPASREEMLALFADWHPEVRALMALAPEDTLIKWAIFDRDLLDRWYRDHVVLIGDAAHPMTPFLGLGAAMALEDALILARALEERPLAEGLATFQRTRLPRVGLVAERSRLQGKLVQAQDPETYDPSTAPAQDPSIPNYDAATAPLA